MGSETGARCSAAAGHDGMGVSNDSPNLKEAQMHRIRIGALVWGIMGTLAMGSALAGQVSRGDLGAIIYAETAGLRPVCADVEGGSETDHDPRSLAQLQAARRWIGEVALSRKFQGVAPPATMSRRDRANPEARQIWQMCRSAASEALPSGGNRADGKRVLHFLLRHGGTPQDGGTPRRPAWARGRMPAMSFGPFRCVGGGDVPAGNNIWIDFFVDIPL